MSIDDATVGRIEHALGEDGVWVSPDLRTEISPADEQRIERAVDAAGPTKVYVVLVEVSYDDPSFAGVDDLFITINDDTGRDGSYVGVDGFDPLQVTASTYGAEDDATFAASAAQARHPDDLADQVVDTVGLIGSGNAMEVYDRIERTEASDQASGSDDGTSIGPGVVVGVVLAVLVVAAGLVVRARRRTLRRGSGLEISPRVLSTVRAAEERERLNRATKELLRLGERIDDATMTGASDAWQAALDHYDVARRVLDRSPSPADVIGVLVLAQRGDAALDAALANQAWAPGRTCYFNPLHGSAASTAEWGGDDGVAVPVCAACARALEKDRTPEDILDFVHAGVPQHYFSLDLAPWSDTGYGSLDPDLLGRLRA